MNLKLILLVTFLVAFETSLTSGERTIRSDVVELMRKMPITGSMSIIDKLRFINYMKMKLAAGKEKKKENLKIYSSLYPANMINPGDF
jgi:hypothetical protein